jgi:hypothetical protein
MTKRRDFIKKSALGSAGIAIGGMGFTSKSYASVIGANDRINVAIIGCRNQGTVHINNWCGIKDSHNVVIKTLCDTDENLFAEKSKIVEDKTGTKPKTEWDLRKVYDDKEIHAVSIVTPNHWHALATIWAAQAGKHIYVEKPVSHNIFEGRKMVEAGVKYKVHIQQGSAIARGESQDFLHKGGIGDIYMARVLILHPRDSYGIAPDSEPPKGFHYDQWLGPAPSRPYNVKRSHYCWHWFWDTGCGDTGNTGPHAIQHGRVGIQKEEHPVSVCSYGGIYGFTKENKTPGKMGYGGVETYGNDRNFQETPNTQTCIFKYKDGTIFEVETRNWYTNAEGTNNITDGNLFYGSEGYMEYTGGWKAFRHREKQPFAGAGIGESKSSSGRGGERMSHAGNLCDVIRSGRDQDLVNPIIGGHYTASLIHLANISYRLGGRALNFNGATEKFVNDPEADKLLTRDYRKPFVVPDKV